MNLRLRPALLNRKMADCTALYPLGTTTEFGLVPFTLIGRVPGKLVWCWMTGARGNTRCERVDA